MDNFDDPLHHESPEMQSVHNCSTTRGIQYFFHMNTLIDGNHKVLFIMISQNQHMHLVHNLNECESEHM